MEILGFDLGSIELGQLWSRVVAFTGPRWLPSLGVVLIAALVYGAARVLLGRAQKSWVTRTETRVDDLAIRLLRQALLLSSGAWAAWRLLGIWGLPNVAQWVYAIWIGVLFFPLSRFVGDLLTALEAEVLARSRTSLDKTALPMINKAIRFVIMALGVVLALSELGINIAPLLAGAGVMGLALSLAAKDTLSNLIAGVLLIVDRPFQVGDRIELWMAPNETGSWGDVIEIGLRATKIRNPDNLVVVVPNNQIMQRDIVNYTMSGQDIRLRIPFAVAYESDIDRAKELLVESASAVVGVKMDPAPIVIARSFGPSEVKLELRVWILEARERRRIGDEISERVPRAFAEAGVEIPYPRRELYIRTDEANAAAGASAAVAANPSGGASPARGANPGDA